MSIPKLKPQIDPVVMVDLIRTRQAAIEKHGDDDTTDFEWWKIHYEELFEVVETLHTLDGLVELTADYQHEEADTYRELLQLSATAIFHAEMILARRS